MKKHDVMKCMNYLLNLFGGRNVFCPGQTTFHEPIGVKYQKKKDYINKIYNYNSNGICQDAIEAI